MTSESSKSSLTSSFTINIDGLPIKLHCGIAVEHDVSQAANTHAEMKDTFTINVDGPVPVRLHGAIAVEHVPQEEISDAEPAASSHAEPAASSHAEPAEPAPKRRRTLSASSHAEPTIDAEPGEPAPKRRRTFCLVDGQYHSLLLVVRKSFAFILKDGQYMMGGASTRVIEQVYEAVVDGRVKPEIADMERSVSTCIE